MISSRNTMAFALAGLVILIAGHIPLPGIDLGLIEGQIYASGNAAMSRVSIFVLGVTPVYTALAFAEIVRLFSTPRQPELQKQSGLGAIVVRLIALVLTALQAYAIAVALKSYGLVHRDFELFVPVAIAACLAATATLLFLLDRVRLDGFRNGFWALYSVPVVLGLVNDFGNMGELLSTGAISLGACLPALAYVALCAAAVVFMASLWDGLQSGGPRVGETAASLPRDILVWPVVLAPFVLETLLTLVATALPDLLSSLGGTVIRVVIIAATILLIPFFVFGYARQCRRQFAPFAPLAPLALVTLMIATVQIALVAANVARDALLPVPFGPEPTSIIALTLTAIGIGALKVPALTLERRGVAARQSGL